MNLPWAPEFLIGSVQGAVTTHAVAQLPPQTRIDLQSLIPDRAWRHNK
jgi:hypothetical protein